VRAVERRLRRFFLAGSWGRDGGGGDRVTREDVTAGVRRLVEVRWVLEVRWEWERKGGGGGGV